MTSPEQRRARRIGRLTETSAWLLLLTLVLPLLVGAAVFVLVLVALT